MPIELLSFTGKCYQKKIELNWITASELNNNRFEIEKYDNNFNNWNYIGSVPGSGTTNRNIEYSFDDFNIEKENTYRIKQIDYDGAFEYTKIISIDCERSSDVFIYYDLYGRTIENPSNGNMYIEFNLTKSESKLIYINY